MTSTVYWLAARSFGRRAAICDEVWVRYSTSIPNRCFIISGSLVRVSGSGGPPTTTFPSRLAAASVSSQDEATPADAEAAEAGADGLAGALVGALVGALAAPHAL